MPQSRNEPIAIIGMACRFPGANDIEAFWRLLREGGNAVSEGVPGSGVGRWGLIFGDEAVQSEGCRYGAFVDDIELFDDSFFRISPVEAQLLDPQQRMMLEVTWQALEDAGIDPERIRGSRTGVYSGISNDEYRMLVVDSAKPSEAASVPLRAQRHQPERHGRAGLVRAGADRARQRRSTPRARPRWWRSTTRWRICSRARPTWRSRAGCRRFSTGASTNCARTR